MKNPFSTSWLGISRNDFFDLVEEFLLIEEKMEDNSLSDAEWEKLMREHQRGTHILRFIVNSK